MIHLRVQCVRITLEMKRKLKIRIQKNSKATKNLEIVTLFVLLLLLCYSGSTSNATLTWKVFHSDDAQGKIYMKS